jgi:hypothetical protein
MNLETARLKLINEFIKVYQSAIKCESVEESVKEAIFSVLVILDGESFFPLTLSIKCEKFDQECISGFLHHMFLAKLNETRKIL